MGVGLFDTLTYQAWQIVLMTFGLVAIGFIYGYMTAYEKINERKHQQCAASSPRTRTSSRS